MGARENLQRIIERKRQEAAELEASLRDARTYIEAMTDAMKALPREPVNANGAGGAEPTLRPGTMVYQVRELLRKSHKPLHISEILQGLGRPIDKKNRVSVSGSLAAYVRNKQIFARPKPNTFGLLEMELTSEAPSATDSVIDDELPESFGH
jgi:hypothetical protein